MEDKLSHLLNQLSLDSTQSVDLSNLSAADVYRYQSKVLGTFQQRSITLQNQIRALVTHKFDSDEINLVESKFNSGWSKVMGPTTSEQKEDLLNYLDFQYSDPEFSWQRVVGPTDLAFVDSDIFKKYEDYLLVGDFHNGEISKFRLNEDRDGFIFKDSNLQDNVLNTEEDSDEIKFAEGFDGT